MGLLSFHVLFSTELDKLDGCLEEKSTSCSFDGIVVQFTFTVRLSVDVLAVSRDVLETGGYG
jgi:hypothetical protein